MSNDTVYVLSMSYNRPGSDGNIYLAPTDRGNVQNKDELTTKLSLAQVFETEDDAWNYRCDYTASIAWQITPIPRKRIFERKLKG